jgi:hypothetical protein
MGGIIPRGLACSCTGVKAEKHVVLLAVLCCFKAFSELFLPKEYWRPRMRLRNVVRMKCHVCQERGVVGQRLAELNTTQLS